MKLALTLKWLGMWLSNFKLSLTRAMKRGKLTLLRSYDELVENANWQRQVREYLEKQQEQVEGHADLLPRYGKGIGGRVYWLFQLVLKRPEEMDRDGEKATRCDSALPEAKRLMSTHVIDASHGEEWLWKLMDFQHPITEEMCIFSKPKTSSINCVAFHFHFPVIKPVEDEKPTWQYRLHSREHLCDRDIMSERTGQLGGWTAHNPQLSRWRSTGKVKANEIIW